MRKKLTRLCKHPPVQAEHRPMQVPHNMED